MPDSAREYVKLHAQLRSTAGIAGQQKQANPIAFPQARKALRNAGKPDYIFQNACNLKVDLQVSSKYESYSESVTTRLVGDR